MFSISMRYPRQKILLGWCAPTHGALKFNVDGSAMGKPSVAGIGGLLRNTDGVVLAIFSMSLGILDSNVAEVNHPDERPWRLLHHFHEIDAFLAVSPNRLVTHIKRERNNDADKLAEEGVS
ncbi:reverse transcriptase [Tanacetum coccineum]|uniref:Reverse transcriptase n=1 Tax=Tanacetum coccineum TaxID=301880 RepID=A0ABQ5ARR3_9ASTR